MILILLKAGILSRADSNLGLEHAICKLRDITLGLRPLRHHGWILLILISYRSFGLQSRSFPPYKISLDIGRHKLEKVFIVVVNCVDKTIKLNFESFLEHKTKNEKNAR